jgi:hypothetical protein
MIIRHTYNIIFFFKQLMITIGIQFWGPLREGKKNTQYIYIYIYILFLVKLVIDVKF